MGLEACTLSFESCALRCEREALAVQVGPDGGDTPLVKLFEFLVASMCLFLISDNDPLEPRRHEVRLVTPSSALPHAPDFVSCWLRCS